MASKAESVDDMKETVKCTEEKFVEKVKELSKANAETELLKSQLADKQKDVEAQEARNNELEGHMRMFTSMADTAENDDTFEAVLRSEFQIMRARLTEKIETLTAEGSKMRTDLIRHRGDS